MKEKDIDGEIRQLDEMLTRLNTGKSDIDILIVDDVYANVFVLESILRDEYFIEHASNADELWAILKRVTPRLVLLDLMMPVVSGFQILERMKNDSVYKTIPVIVVSARDSRDDVMKAIGLGAADYMIKPIDENVLLEKVGKVLGKGRGAGGRK